MFLYNITIAAAINATNIAITTTALIRKRTFVRFHQGKIVVVPSAAFSGNMIRSQDCDHAIGREIHRFSAHFDPYNANDELRMRRSLVEIDIVRTTLLGNNGHVCSPA